MKKKTLVLGASLKTNRYSNIAIRKLVNYQHDIVAFGMKTGVVEGVSIDVELVDYTDLDTVTLYLNPQRQEAYYTYIIELQPKRVIFNPGTENPEFYKLLEAQNIAYEESCTLVLLSTDQY
jgi:predicted CoA-binding protein